MHVPDGFLAPSTWISAYGLSAGLWTWGARRVGRAVRPETLPQIGVLTAACFVLMMLSIPLPGGATVHFTGVAVLAVLFGAWTAFLCVSLVLLLQATLLGTGGITSLAVGALAIGGLGGVSAAFAWRALRRWRRRAALFVAAWVSVVLPALAMALVLGLQLHVATDAQGSPLFFPLGWSVVVPALVGPHLLLGLGEGVLTVLMVEAFDRLRGEAVA